MGAILFFLLIGGIVVAVIMFSIKTAEETKKKWDLAARTLKLRYLKGSMFNPGVITGNLKNHLIKVDTFSRSSGKNSQTYTRFRIDYDKPLKHPFTITKQNFMHNFGKAFGMQDIELGDASFDDKVMIKSNNPTFLKEFLTSNRKDLIVTLMGLFHEVNITNTHVEIIIRGTVSNSKLIQSNVKRLSKLADGFFPKDRKKHSSPEKPVKTPQTVEVIAPVVVEEKKVQNKEFVQKPEFVEVELPDETKPTEIENMPEVETVLPDIVEKEPAVASTQKEPEIEEINLPEEVEKVEEDKEGKEEVIPRGITAEVFCKEVFDSGGSAFDSSKVFEDKYKDTKISWEGTLISVAEFSFDFVFKNTSGVKATFEVFEVDSGYTTTKVKTVVHFPKEQFEKLKASVNNKIEFSGRLISVDGLVKNIFAAEGKLN